MKTTGIVLAGGLSRRFGEPKAFYEFEGKFFYDYAVDALKLHCEEIIIVTRPEFVNRFPRTVKVMIDDEEYAGLGPLAGIYSAMKNGGANRYIVLPCDMPYMDGEFIGQLLAHGGQMIAVKLNEQTHPLVSIWSNAVLPALKKTLDDQELRVAPFLERMQVKWVDGAELTNDPVRRLKNMNRQTDLERGDKG